MKSWKYFSEALEKGTVEALKAIYRKLVLKFHPDREGGSEEIMKEVNAEYETIFNFVKAKQEGAEDATERNTGKKAYRASKNHSVNDGFREIIFKIASIKGIIVELCGSWIWVTGETKPAKELLKSAGFRWSQPKKAWYWHTDGWVKQSRRHFSMEDIREMHGSILIKGKESEPESAQRKNQKHHEKTKGYAPATI
jgi:curved DNA-binding protein CbpA